VFDHMENVRLATGIHAESRTLHTPSFVRKEAMNTDNVFRSDFGILILSDPYRW